MEFMIDYDIQGEILLPLKYTEEFKNNLKYEDLFDLVNMIQL